ncbi:MAG TPA: hypothetical protein VM095_02565 [Pyrinomonadaceae bacterium]|nr:hypothetical protein [Pyrinomonadaceae bacterium]
MPNTPRTPSGLHSLVADEGGQSSRLSWLLMENERAAMQPPYRNAREEVEIGLMSRPISIKRAYTHFGMLLGTFPPLAIFYKVLDSMAGHQWVYIAQAIFILLLIMLAVCCLVGRAMGSVMGGWLAGKEGGSRTRTFFHALVAGISWGAVTGAAGGVPAFGIGAIYGQAFAVAVGIVAFPLFAMLHRPLARGGMIDARHFRPLACGVVMVITALILGM